MTDASQGVTLLAYKVGRKERRMIRIAGGQFRVIYPDGTTYAGSLEGALKRLTGTESETDALVALERQSAVYYLVASKLKAQREAKRQGLEIRHHGKPSKRKPKTKRLGRKSKKAS